MTTDQRLQVARIAVDLLKIAIENASKGRKDLTGKQGQIDHEKVREEFQKYFDSVIMAVTPPDGDHPMYVGTV